MTMIELTEQQSHQIGEGGKPIKVIDQTTQREFYLVAADDFSKLQIASEDCHPREAYPAIERAFAPGWDDEKMAEYDTYEQHKR